MSNSASAAGSARAREVRARWKEIRRAPRRAPDAPLLKVAVLGSYTVDPLIPYLGVAVTDAGFRALLRTGPYNQIVQECLDDQSGTATFAPDVLVVSPRLEELWAGRSFPPGPEAEPGCAAAAVDDLLQVVQTTLDAAERWRCTLIFVLPPVPDDRLGALGDDNHPGGSIASANWAREQVRARVTDESNACVVDLEAVLRSVGTVHAHHPAMFRHAKIPYTEEVFAALGARIGRTLRLRFGDACQVAALDLVGLVATVSEADDIVPLLRRLAANGFPAHIVGDRRAALLWRELGSAASEIPALVADWLFDGRSVADQLRGIAAREAVPPGHVALVSKNPEALAAVRGVGVPLELGPEPDLWPTELAASALFDRLPASGVAARSQSLSPERPRPSSAGLSLDAFVAQLGAEVEFSTARDGHIDKISEMMHRTKDFTLGTVLAPEQIAAALADEQRDVVVGSVRDRFGDFGLSVAVALHQEGPVCTVEAMLISCPVMGKGVEEAVMRRIVEMATGRGCQRIRMTYRRTGRNQVAVDFIEAAPVRVWGTGGIVAPVIEPVMVSE